MESKAFIIGFVCPKNVVFEMHKNAYPDTGLTLADVIDVASNIETDPFGLGDGIRCFDMEWTDDMVVGVEIDGDFQEATRVNLLIGRHFPEHYYNMKLFLKPTM